MTRPGWATIVGVLGIIFGCFGIIGNGQLAAMPKIMEFQKEMLSSMQESFQKQNEQDSKEEHPMPPEAMFTMFEKMWNFPQWYGSWCVVAGLLGMAVSAFYLFASIQLLQVKPTGIRLFYWASGLDIGLVLLKAGAAMLASTPMGFMVLTGGVFGLAIDGVLLVVVATGEKKAFVPEEA